jgi:putative nucleotidyltransferase with HDIG domain
MFGLPRSASLLWWAVTAPGVAVVSLSGYTALEDTKWLPVALLFVVSGSIAERFRVALPSSAAAQQVSSSISAAILIAAILVLPPQWAVLVVAISIGVGGPGVWYKRLYNISQTSIAAGLAGVAWKALGGSPATLASVQSAPSAALAALTYFTVNAILPSAIAALASGLPVGVTLWRNHKHVWQARLAIAFMGVMIAVLWSASPWAIALAGLALTAVYYALRNTVHLETETVQALFDLADILDARDAYTHGHSLRVGQYAEKLALAMGLSGDDAHLIFLAGRLHDIGKCAIKNEVLLKPGPLSDEEREHMCIHPEVGSQMLASFSLFSECARFVRGHHERWDGQGYPDHLKGDNIPLGARIIAVADTYDAMTTTRPYRTALPLAEAKRRLAEGAGSQWDPRCIAAFLKLLETTPLGQPEPTQLTPATRAKAA